MKIGVGVITMGVRALKDYKTGADTYFYVHVDKEHLGVSHARNQCIKHLYENGCDYIFVFDDDNYPTMYGWENYFVEQAEKHNMHFFVLPEAFKDEFLGARGEIGFWSGGLCQFALYSRKCIEEIGYYNEEYDRYGYEDAGYMHRVWNSGINGPLTNGHPSPIRVLAYIHSEDVYGENPKSNISQEDKLKYIDKNYPIYQKEINCGKIYYKIGEKDCGTVA